jgi:hypothetical protein
VARTVVTVPTPCPAVQRSFHALIFVCEPDRSIAAVGFEVTGSTPARSRLARRYMAVAPVNALVATRSSSVASTTICLYGSTARLSAVAMNGVPM